MKIVKKNVNTIKPYWRNPRKNDGGVDALMESITKFGFTVPITVDKDDIIITGHTRYKAVLKLVGTLSDHIKTVRKDNGKLADNLEDINNGMIYVIVRDDLSEDKIKEFRIADNKVGELSHWDMELLKYEIRELENVIGFAEGEIDHLLRDTTIFEEYTDEDVKETTERMESYYDDSGEQELFELYCPECNHKFFVSGDDIRSMRSRNYSKE